MMSEKPFMEQAAAFVAERGTTKVTLSFESEGLVWRDDQERVIPEDDIPEWLVQGVQAGHEASMRELVADIQAAQRAHPEDWPELHSLA